MGKSQDGAGQEDPAASKRRQRKRDAEDELVDTQGEQSFPASDPPGWTLGPDKADGNSRKP